MLQFTSSEAHPIIQPRRAAYFCVTARPAAQGGWRINIVADYVPTQDFITADDPLEVMRESYHNWLKITA